MDAAEDSGPKIAFIKGEAVIHQRFGGAGPSGLNTARENAHGALMRCKDAAGGPAPRCVAGAGTGCIAHTKDCDQATDLLGQLRTLFDGCQAQR